MRAPAVSVIMPSYQKAPFVAAAVESVLAQTLTDLELIVVDSSTDETPQILERFGARIRVVRDQPRGISAARNLGIRSSRGRYIAFIDADDTWMPTKLEKQIALLERNGKAGLVCADVLFRDAAGPRPGRAFLDAAPASGQVHPVIFSRSFIGTLTVVVRRACLDEVGLFDESISACEDHDLWLRISARWEIEYVDEPLAVYRYSAGQASADRERTLAGVASKPGSGLIAVQERAYAGSPALRALDRATLDRCFFDLYLELAGLHVRAGRTAAARAVLSRHRQLRGWTARSAKLWAASGLPPWAVRRLDEARS
jgi:glycosyltransferase involved in cell wall biosynthesis